MISRVAISYDLSQVRSHLLDGHTKDALEQIALLTENLELLLYPHKSGPQACSADEFGRKNVQALRSRCSEIASAILQRDLTGAESALDKAQEFWGSHGRSMEPATAPKGE